ncbi:MAG: ABC transporter permease [Armatimonadetes bacterium]|nr:ABC transporter permease [Armatimonadota bacterium]MBX3109720.1 ABC transporter permease [Fimbriimonadaceae bacterium]
MKATLKKIDFQRDGVLIAFVLFAVFAVFRWGDVFQKPDTWRNLLCSNADVGILAVGMTLVIIGGGIDLSVGSLLALAGVLGIQQMGSGPVWVGVLWMVGTAATLGLAQGVVVTWGRVAPFVATLVGLLVFRSSALTLSKGGTVVSQNPALADLTSKGFPIPGLATFSGKPLMVFWSGVLFVAVALVAGFLLNQTPYGRRLVAVGSNERAAKYSAVNVGAIRVWSFVVMGVCAGLAAWVYASKLNSVPSQNAGNLYELESIAAVVIGGTSLRGGQGRIWGTVVGVLILGMIGNILIAAEVDTYLQGIVKGAIILFAVLIARGKKTD